MPAQSTLHLSNAQIPENADWVTPIGQLTWPDGPSPDSVEYTLLDTADAAYFSLQGNTLYAHYSFDYEERPEYTVYLRAGSPGLSSVTTPFTIQVVDLVGKYDTDGLADTDLAAKYPQVEVGDYLIFNANNLRHIYKDQTLTDSIHYPNKILIKAGNYDLIHLRLSSVRGESARNRVPITNFLGQVRTRVFRIYDGRYWRLTGQYDPLKRIGSPWFRGCRQREETVNFGFSRGTYGIWIRNGWISEEGNSNLSVEDAASHFEIDHLEISDGGFAGALIKEENGEQPMDSVHLHHLYIHDIGSEGIYLGSTQPDPQHQFNDLLVEHCAILRTGGEALQLEQLGRRCVVRNNVLWGAMDWLSPFQRYQDNTAQFSVRAGGLTFVNNILIGAGEKFFNVSNKPLPGAVPTGDSILVQNNLAWACRGPFGVYQFEQTDGVTPWVWSDNYWGHFQYDYDRVYIDHHATADQVFSIASDDIVVTLRGNIYDDSRGRIGGAYAGSNAHFKRQDNRQDTLYPPEFIQLLGQSPDHNFLLWSRWTAEIGESPGFTDYRTRKGEPAWYSVGEIVQYWHGGDSRFYRCLQDHHGQEPPPQGNAYWALLHWVKPNGDTTYYPPDDVRLQYGSFYQQKGMGIGADQEPCGADDHLQDAQLAPGNYVSSGTLRTSGQTISEGWVVLSGAEVILEPGFRVLPGHHLRVMAQPCRLGAATRQSVVPQFAAPARRKGKIQLRVFPNPVRHQLTLHWTLPKATELTCAVYAASGQQVAIPFRERFFPKGDHQWIWPLSFLPAGNYIFSLWGSGYQEVAQVQVLR